MGYQKKKEKFFLDVKSGVMTSQSIVLMNVILLWALTMVCSSMSLAGHHYMQATE